MYASCFDANAGIFEVLLGENDAVFSDQLNHASIIDGLRLAKTRKFRYKNKGECQIFDVCCTSCETSLYMCLCVVPDMQELSSQLREAKDAEIKLIVSDGVFSMDGSITPLPYVCMFVHVSARMCCALLCVCVFVMSCAHMDAGKIFTVCQLTRVLQIVRSALHFDL